MNENQKEEIKNETQTTQPQFAEPSYSTINQFKRHIAHKFKIGQILEGNPILENDRLRFLEINNENIARVNLIANIIDKFIQEGEKKYASITLDDASGQIRIKTFGEDIIKFSNLNQGDTILVIGLLKYWNNEIYIAPEIIKKKDAQFLLVRKLEIEASQPKTISKEKLTQLKDKILQKLKESEKQNNQGVEIESLILELKEHSSTINQEIKKIIEDGLAYEPRPGKLRYLG